MKPWPGRNNTPQRSEDELCLVVRASPTHPSLIHRRQHFLQRTVLGVRFLVKLEAPLYFILFYLRSQDESANVASLCVVSSRALVACRFFCNLVDCRFFANPRCRLQVCLRVDRRLQLVGMDEAVSGPRRHLVAPNTSIARVLMDLKPSHKPLDDWFFTHPHSSVLAEELEELEMQNDEEFEAEFEEFDEGDDLEPDLAASLSTADREAADKNCLAFDKHVSEVGFSGLTIGPFRTPIEPCTSANYNFNCTFGAAVAPDKIRLITNVISHLFGAFVLKKMVQRFIRRWSGGVFSNADTSADKLLEHGMIAGNPNRKNRKLMNGMPEQHYMIQQLYTQCLLLLVGTLGSSLVIL